MIINVGDTVRLKSGGPLMTVVEIHPKEKMISAAWFVGPDLRSLKFPETSLDVVNGRTH